MIHLEFLAFQSGLDLKVYSVLIRLSQTPTRCSGSGFDGVKLGIGRRGDVAGDAEQ